MFLLPNGMVPIRLTRLAAIVLSAAVAAPNATAQIADFEGDPENWLALTTNTSGEAPVILTDGPTGNYLRLTHLSTGILNSFAFDEAFAGGDASSGLHIAFDFRMTGDEANAEAGGCCDSAADGLGAGVFFTDPGQWPATGNFNPMAGTIFGGSIWERPNVPYSITVGLDIFPNIDEVNVNVNTGGSAAAMDLANVDVAADFDLDLNDEVWHRAVIIIDGAGTMGVDIIEDAFGEANTHNVVAGLSTGLNMSDLPPFRFAAGGRTGSALVDGDIDTFIAGLGTDPFGVPGDVNDDGVTDQADFDIISLNMGQQPATRGEGDANRNGRVDLLDFRLWKRNLGATAEEVAAAGGAVPEPTGIALAVCGLLAGVAATRRRRVG